LNKKRHIAGLALIAAGVFAGLAAYFWYLPHPGSASYAAVVLLIAASVLVMGGLGLSVGELAKSVVRRLKAAREREKAIRDRRRQARQSKPDSTSQ
jgi:hypothetical protein